MENTLQIGDRLIGNRLARNYKRGDIVIFQDDSGTYLVKRLIGEPGDHVQIMDNVVYINDVELEEPYLKEPMDSDDYALNVPEDSYLFLGDNRNNSLDSRYWDNPYISRERLVAKVLFKYFKNPKSLLRKP